MTRPLFRLKLKSLKFVSAVDDPAQEHAHVSLVKRAGAEPEYTATAIVQKVDESLGLVFGYALVTEKDGEAYYDLQGDAIEGGDDLIKAALEFMTDGGGAADVMHDENPDGRVVFCMPVTPDVAKALGWETATYGLAIAMKPSPATFKRFQSGELKAFSIGGRGERTPVEKSAVEKKSVLTTSTLGHAHLIGGIDDMQAGTTSGERIPTVVGDAYHSHPWVRNEDGLIVIGEAMGHTHALASTEAAPAAELEKRAAKERAKAEALAKKLEADAAYEKKVVADNLAWLVTLSPEYADSVAKHNVNSLGKWGQRWLDGERPEGVAKAAVDVMKSAQSTIEKTSARIDALVAKRRPAMLAERKTKGMSTDAGVVDGAILNALVDDQSVDGNQFRELYAELEKAERTLQLGDVEKVAKARAAADAAYDASEKFVEDYALSQMIEVNAARSYLAKNSSGYKALLEAHDEAEKAVTQARVDNDQMVADFEHAQAQKHAAAKAAEVAAELEAERKSMSPSERALFDRIDAIGKQRNLARPDATAWAMDNDETCQALYAVYSAESR